MFIQIEETPNINALKFLPGYVIISPEKPFDFPTLEYAKEISGLAYKIMQIEGVQRVFFGNNFITVTKKSESDWILLKPHIFACIMEYISNGFPIFNDGDNPSYINPGIDAEVDKRVFSEKPKLDDPIIKSIIDLIEERVRPGVEMDGGAINFINFIDNIVYVEMLGSCSGCSSADITLKDGIENMLKHYIPEVKEVRKI